METKPADTNLPESQPGLGDPEIRISYSQSFKEEYTIELSGSAEVAAEAIVALLDARDFLSYQLTHANGGMTDEQLDEIAAKYLYRDTWKDTVLGDRIRILRMLIEDRLDAYVVSTVFHCSIEQAVRVIEEVRPSLSGGHTPTAFSAQHDG